MKRFTLLLLCALFVLSSSVLFALPASAAEKIVYVNDGGTGNGSSSASPFGTLDAAYNALSATGGTIAIVEKFTLTANFENGEFSDVPYAYHAPQHSRQITITSADSAKKASLYFTDDCMDYALGGVTVFKNLIIASENPRKCFIEAMGYHLTMDEGVEMLDTTGTAVHASTAVNIVGTCVRGNVPDNYAELGSWVTLKSGVYGVVCPRSFQVQNTTPASAGDAYLEILGDVTINELGMATWGGADQVPCTGKNIFVWDANITGWRFFIGYNYSASLESTTTMILKDNAKYTVHPLAGASPQGFCGLAKVTGVLVYAEDTSSSANQLADTIQFLAFTKCFPEVEKLSAYNGALSPDIGDVAPLEDTAPVVPPVTAEPTPETDPAPVTTGTQEGGEPTPPTGDMAAVILAVTLVSLAAVLFLSRKKSHN